MPQTFDERRLVGVLAERITNVSSRDFPAHYPDEDHTWNLQKFKKNLTVKVQKLSQHSIDFDLVGVDASIANAFRRIMIAEVPTVAIEQVFVWNNNTVIHDEVLAHRLGLVPLNVDPALMEMRGPDDPPTDRNTIVFHVDITCERNPKAPKGSDDPHELYINSEFLSSELTWAPAGEQDSAFAGRPPAPINKNIVLAKLRPGQTINMELHAVKGVGKDHAKFSPVGTFFSSSSSIALRFNDALRFSATASYRLLPHIKITKPIPPSKAEKFQKCFSPGVIKIDSRTQEVSVDEENARNDTVSREVLRHPEFAGSVELSRVRDFFLFNVESEGPYAPERILPEAIKVMREKLAVLRQAAVALREKSTTVDSDVVMAES